jgi:hypothetical protein
MNDVYRKKLEAILDGTYDGDISGEDVIAMQEIVDPDPWLDEAPDEEFLLAMEMAECRLTRTESRPARQPAS